MALEEFVNNVLQFAQDDPQTFWIVVGVIVVVLFFLLKGGKGGSESPIPDGLNPAQWFEMTGRK